MTSAKLASRMRAVRRHLHSCVAVWLVFQALALSSIVPRDCCAAHRPVSAKSKAACHELMSPAPDVQAHHAQAAPTPDRCSLRGSCGGPMAGFLVQLSLHGVLTERPRLTLQLVASTVEPVASERLISRLASPDSPPPRA